MACGIFQFVTISLCWKQMMRSQRKITVRYFKRLLWIFYYPFLARSVMLCDISCSAVYFTLQGGFKLKICW